MATFKIRLNSVEKMEALLQEVYDDAVRQQNMIQNLISELTNSTNLADAPIEAKTKYAKALHDYATDKDKAIGRKIEVSKLMGEIIKSNGDIEKVLSDKEVDSKLDLDDMMKKIREQGTVAQVDEIPQVETYITNTAKPRKPQLQ